MSYLLIRGDARRIPLADKSVHMVLTSPPYYGLRDYGCAGQIGLEETPEQYISTLADVFREVRRVLRDDGVVWLNLGDSYSSSLSNQNGRSREGFHGGNTERWVSQGHRCRSDCGLAPKQLLGIPWRVAFALQADGWYLRADCVWSKPNPMPESVRDRPTKSHEYIFLLAKSVAYYYDADAVREPWVRDYTAEKPRLRGKSSDGRFLTSNRAILTVGGKEEGGIQAHPLGRNRRSVWTIATQPLKAAHFATMPPKLAALCIKAGTSQKGCCPRCGALWRRRVRKSRVATRPGTDSKVNRASQHADSPYEGHSGMIVGNRDPKRYTTVTRTVDWESACTCLEPRPVPCVVLDPFGGAGTTPLVATALGRHGIALDLKPEYLALARRRIERPHVRHVGTGQGADLPLFAHLEDP
jgi:DNA modification methylase